MCFIWIIFFLFVQSINFEIISFFSSQQPWTCRFDIFRCEIEWQPLWFGPNSIARANKCNWPSFDWNCTNRFGINSKCFGHSQHIATNRNYNQYYAQWHELHQFESSAIDHRKWHHFESRRYRQNSRP